MAKKVLIAYYSRRGENYVNGSIRNLKLGNPYQLVKIGEFDREIVSLLKKSGSSVKVEIGIE